MTAPVVPVAVVGAGPTGLAAAILLAQYGIECVVLERWASVYPRPRAVHVDDEVCRILARLGVTDAFAAVSRPCLGLRLVDSGMRVLAEFGRSAAEGRHGFPEANMFDQPRLEGMLRDRLARHHELVLRGDTEVAGIVPSASGPVRLDTVDRRTGERGHLLAEYVLGCDGADSLVRRSIDASMLDLRFAQRWLVVDVDAAAELGAWEGVHQVCDPDRPATYMRIGTTRHRWEFRLPDGASAEDYRGIGDLHPLIAPWTKDTPVALLDLVRVAEYTFRAGVADRWRSGRVFLLGDAAHLTPPFIGQGIGAGLRDAANLAWKLAGVLHGTLPERALDSYQDERLPHVRTMIRLAKLVGVAMTGGGEAGRVIRRVVAPRLRFVPGLRERVLSSETPPLRRSSLVLGGALAGRLCPNVRLADGRRFDELAGGRFTVVTARRISEEDQSAIAERGAVVVTASPGDELHDWLRRRRAVAALVRPDGTVTASGRDPRRLVTALTAAVAPRSARDDR